MTPTNLCGICKGDPNRRAFVNSELAKQTPHTRIEQLSKEVGLNVKRETIRKHVTVCVPAALKEATYRETNAARSAQWREARRAERVALSANTEVQARPSPKPPAQPSLPVALEGMPETDDFATLVREEARRKLLAGELRVTTQDGLSAQSLLDKREEKKKDRELMAQMGLLLARGSEPPPMLEATTTIEGDYEEIRESA